MMKKGSIVTYHLNKFNTLINKLVLVGVMMEDKVKTNILLCSLLDIWGSIGDYHHQIIIMNSEIWWCGSHLLGEELRGKLSLEPSTNESLSMRGRSSERGQQGDNGPDLSLN